MDRYFLPAVVLCLLLVSSLSPLPAAVESHPGLTQSRTQAAHLIEKDHAGAGDTATAIAALSRAPQNTVSITVDNSIEHQTIYGFGVTHNSEWFGSDPITQSQRDRANDLLFNQVGINTGNVSWIDESPASSTSPFQDQANDNSDPFTINWAGFNTLRADFKKTKQLDVAPGDAAPAAGGLYPATHINVRWASKWLDAVRTSDYEAYLNECAEQVLAGVTYWTNQTGSGPKYISLFNEPSSGNRELGTSPTRPDSEIVDIIARAGDRLRAAGFTRVMIVAPSQETVGKTIQTAQAILNNADARQYLGAIGYHPYPYRSDYSYVPNILSASGQGNPSQTALQERTQLLALARAHNLPLWMTEVSHAFMEGDGVQYNDFRVLRGRAIHIHDAMKYAEASAFFGMMDMWSKTAQSWHFGGDGSNIWTTNFDTIVLIDQDTDRVLLTGMAYAIGHYARWIKRGATRLEASTSDSLVQITAFRDDRLGRLVLVAINNTSSSRTATVSVSNLALEGRVEGEQSTETGGNWVAIAPFDTAADGFSATLPPYSVNTYSVPLASVSSRAARWPLY